MNLLDFLFPKTCVSCSRLGSYLCSECLSKVEYLKLQICPVCYQPAINGKTHPKCQTKWGLDGVVSLCNYQNPTKELIKSLKYRFTTDLLTEFAAKFSFDSGLLPNKEWVVLPLPLHKSKQNYRGFNQAECLGEIVEEKFGLGFEVNLLRRKRSTKSQVGLGQKQRKVNIAAAFEVVGQIAGKSFYIFDDVWTSGATLKSAASTLKKAGAAKVWGLTLAHPR